MPKVLGIHELVTKPDVDAAAFERFLRQEAIPTLRLPGTTISFLKGDRGERSGHYLMIMQVESVESRNRLFPDPGTVGAEAREAFEAGRAVFERWATFGTPPGSEDATYTDYVELSTQ